MVLGAEVPQPHGQELLGWLIIPYGLAVGIAFLLGTTAFLRWMLQFVPRASRQIRIALIRRNHPLGAKGDPAIWSG